MTSMDRLRYRGDITETIDRDQMLGPDIDRRYIAARKVEYDAETDCTVVTARGILPDEFEERVTKLVVGQQERERIRRLFNG